MKCGWLFVFMSNIETFYFMTFLTDLASFAAGVAGMKVFYLYFLMFFDKIRYMHYFL